MRANRITCVYQAFSPVLRLGTFSDKGLRVRRGEGDYPPWVTCYSVAARGQTADLILILTSTLRFLLYARKVALPPLGDGMGEGRGRDSHFNLREAISSSSRRLNGGL